MLVSASLTLLAALRLASGLPLPQTQTAASTSDAVAGDNATDVAAAAAQQPDIFVVLKDPAPQSWTAPVTGWYTIAARGASGGAPRKPYDDALGAMPEDVAKFGGDNGRGGHGAHASANFLLEAGQELQLIVGQRGESNAGSSMWSNFASGGGGASYVFHWADDDTNRPGVPLVVGGGGAGASFKGWDEDKRALSPVDGGDSYVLSDVDDIGYGGAGGRGPKLNGGGGAGFHQLGGNGEGVESGSGGRSNNLNGPARDDWYGGKGGVVQFHHDAQDGGYGGGAGAGWYGGGGGGGYRGGDGSSVPAYANGVQRPAMRAQAGTSYIAADGKAPAHMTVQEQGNGVISIKYLPNWVP